MKLYWVEGLYLPGKRVKKAGKASAAGTLEPFAKSYWANSPNEALQMALEDLKGGQWIKGPKISTTSEEKRMRNLGAPELPGIDGSIKKDPS
jgi:hypothetical protein